MDGCGTGTQGITEHSFALLFLFYIDIQGLEFHPNISFAFLIKRNFDGDICQLPSVKT